MLRHALVVLREAATITVTATMQRAALFRVTVSQAGALPTASKKHHRYLARCNMREQAVLYNESGEQGHMGVLT